FRNSIRSTAKRISSASANAEGADMAQWRRMQPRVVVTVISIAALSAAAADTWTPPRTPWGDPDLSGVWNYATMTPLERPREYADKAVLSEDEAAAFEGRTNARQATTNNTAGPDWWDPGTRRLAGRRTALIVDPPNGRLPPLTADAQQRAA